MDQENYLQSLKSLLGKEVLVHVDRPLGSHHPKYPDHIYPINYGYIEDFLAPDGDFQDAYLLGIDEAVESYFGVVIAIVLRHDDEENKLVVAPKGRDFMDEEIRSAIEFQERYFQSKIIR